MDITFIFPQKRFRIFPASSRFFQHLYMCFIDMKVSLFQKFQLQTVDGRTLKIVLLKMQGYSTKEIAPLVHLTTGAIYARLDHLRKKLRKIL